MKFLTAILLFLGRICIAALFLKAALGKILDYDQVVAYMANKGFTYIPFFLLGGALIEAIGGLSLFFGYKTRAGAFLLLLFMIPTTLIFHNFWDLEAAARGVQEIMFFKNLAIFGGLLYILCYGAGAFSFDHLHRKKELPHEPLPPR